MLWVILIICSVMCNRQAKELGYRDKEDKVQVDHSYIEIRDDNDSLIYKYEE